MVINLIAAVAVMPQPNTRCQVYAMSLMSRAT